MDSHNQGSFNIDAAIDFIRWHGFIGQQDMADILVRVIKTREALHGADVDAKTIYRTMQETTTTMRRFPGDAELFFGLYQELSPIDSRGILSILQKTSQRLELFAPDVLIDKFAEHITETVHTVLLPECERYGAALIDIIESHPEVRFTLTCKRDAKFELLSEVYAPYSNVRMQQVDIYSFGFTTEKFDLIAAIPVFGGRVLVDDEDFISREPDMIAVQNLLYHITFDGELVIVLPAKITFAGGSTAALREYIEKNYRIKEISALPEGLFTPYTSIRTYLFVFSNGAMDDVVLKRYIANKPIRRNAPCEQLIVKNELLLFSDEFAAINGWNIDMAFSEEDDDIRAFNDSVVKKLPLREVATVFRGKAITTKSTSGNIAVINISNITDTGIDYSSLDYIEEEEHKAARYALAAGDVLVTARGTTVKIAVFEAQAVTCIPSANINVIRPKSQLLGTYLKLFLDSPVGGKMLRSLQRGTGVVNINYKDMSELEVPVLPIEEQESIVQEYYTGLAFYKETIAAAEEGWRKLQQEIQSKLF